MFKLAGYFTRFGSRSDGSASLAFTTQEIGGEQFAELKEHQNLFGHIMFKENEITEEDIPTEHAEKTSKTPSQRLRATIFILWSQTGKNGNYEAFYAEKMEKLIDIVKAKLD